MDNFAAEIQKRLFAHQPPTSLWHYTSIEALHGIVSTKSLWATNIHYLNDPKEVGHAIDLIKDEIRQRAASAIDPARKVLDQMQQYLSTSFGLDLIFVTSLTRSEDDLSQWRGYCRSGTGLSVGFDSSHLGHCAEKQNFLLGPCIYDYDEKRRIISWLLDQIVDAVAQNGEADTKTAHPTQSYFPTLRIYQRMLLLTTAMMKHHTFKGEDEWRLISPIYESYKEAPIFYRCGKSMMVPYLLFKLETDKSLCGIRKVVIGPGPNMELSCRSVLMFLAKYGVKQEPISTRPSRIPYRDW